jgi:hypothetical protein
MNHVEKERREKKKELGVTDLLQKLKIETLWVLRQQAGASFEFLLLALQNH